MRIEGSSTSSDCEFTGLELAVHYRHDDEGTIFFSRRSHLETVFSQKAARGLEAFPAFLFLGRDDGGEEGKRGRVCVDLDCSRWYIRIYMSQRCWQACIDLAHWLFRRDV